MKEGILLFVGLTILIALLIVVLSIDVSSIGTGLDDFNLHQAMAEVLVDHINHVSSNFSK